jgi:DNA-directed RNA polymerase subunit RPC12/RpoP
VTIEFRCPYCAKELKVSDDKAGVQAFCPACGERVTIPAPMGEPTSGEPAATPVPAPGVEGASAGNDAVVWEEDSAGQGAAAADSAINCPMCGTSNPRSQSRCTACGENLRIRESTSTSLQVGDVFNSAWIIFQKNVGLSVGATAVFFGAMLVSVFAMYAALFGLGFLLGAAGGGAPGGINQDELGLFVIAMMSLMGLAIHGVTCYMQGGMHALFHRMACGAPVSIADLFSGGRWFWRVFFGQLIFTIMIYIGLVLCLFPAVYVAMVFWPFMYVLVDQDVGLIESFRRSWAMTSGNLFAIFVLGLAAMGAQMLGGLACYIGLLFTTPFMFLLFAVAYCNMTGQRTAD